MRCAKIDMGGFAVVKEKIAEGRQDSFEEHTAMCRDMRKKNCLIEGYREMSRINLSLANSALNADNGVLARCEQELAECE